MHALWRQETCVEVFQQTSYLSPCAVVSHSGSTEFTHIVLDLQRVIVCKTTNFSKPSLK